MAADSQHELALMELLARALREEAVDAAIHALHVAGELLYGLLHRGASSLEPTHRLAALQGPGAAPSALLHALNATPACLIRIAACPHLNNAARDHNRLEACLQ